MNRHICFITDDYPEDGRPVYTFVKNIVDALADNGNRCTVISPFSITRHRRLHKNSEIHTTEKGCVVRVLRPNILTISNLSIMGFKLSNYTFDNSVYKALDNLEQKPDVIYAHFWRNALSAHKYASRNNIPLFVATGESVIDINNFNSKLDDFSSYVSGVICVSTKNKEESIYKRLTGPEKCAIIPNAINPSVFFKMDKLECRRKLGIDPKIFISITVGDFGQRKGTSRVAAALEQISDSIYSIFIGNGSDIPHCKNILFGGKVDNIDLPIYLNAADVFVLPTLHEGCCNAIIEAMACGLPIISSNLSFNWDILNKTNSILIDPNDISEISRAIKLLKDKADLRNSLSKGALETATLLTLNNRAKRIERFIDSKIISDKI